MGLHVVVSSYFGMITEYCKIDGPTTDASIRVVQPKRLHKSKISFPRDSSQVVAFQNNSFSSSYLSSSKMPLWQIYHPAGTYEDPASKIAFAEDITKMYTDFGLPAFYVVTNFIPLPKEDILVGGEPKLGKPFIRIVITHIAIKMPNEDVT
jgi:hypothetical protein